MTSLMRILARGKKGKHGFTLVELMVVIIIVGILAAAAVPIYRGFVKRAYSSEAKATVGAIRTAELVWKAEKAVFLYPGDGVAIPDDEAGVLKLLGVEIAENRWFNDTALVTFDAATGVVQVLAIADPVAGIGAKIELASGALFYTTDDGVTWIPSG